MSEFTVQCEGCGDNIPESEAELDDYPGRKGPVTLAWCDNCTMN